MSAEDESNSVINALKELTRPVVHPVVIVVIILRWDDNADDDEAATPFNLFLKHVNRPSYMIFIVFFIVIFHGTINCNILFINCVSGK